MDLRDNNINIGELLESAEAKALLKREFPQLMNPLTLSLAKKMRLSEVLELSKGKVEAAKVEAVLRELREL